MKVACLALVVGSAVAFAPQQKTFVSRKLTNVQWCVAVDGVACHEGVTRWKICARRHFTHGILLLSTFPIYHVTGSSLFADSQTTRSDFITQAAAALVTGSAALLQQPQPANAAKYGGFGAGSPSVLNPSEAEVDTEVLGSGRVQDALKKVKGYKSAVNTMQTALEGNPQFNVKPVIAKELDFAGLRETLNTVNSAFEEDTQRGTDRLIRVIMQDITELESANNQKDGIERSPRRLENMKGKLAKLDQAFSDYLAFAK